MPLLQVSDLCVEINRKPILQDLSFSLEAGETLVVLGPNGAGKTVLLRTILGLLPHAGTITWRKGVRIGYVPQRVPHNRELPVTVRDFFNLKGASDGRATEALARVGVTRPDFLDKQLGIISSGQFQRVLIAWALLNDPDVLVFDEPTAGIDVEGERTIRALLEKTQKEKNMALILVTHNPADVPGANKTLEIRGANP